jgi:hypothetical protein
MALLTMKKPMVSSTAMKDLAMTIIPKPRALPSSETLIIATSPQRLVKGPVRPPWTTAEMIPMKVSNPPTC